MDWDDKTHWVRKTVSWFLFHLAALWGIVALGYISWSFLEVAFVTGTVKSFNGDIVVSVFLGSLVGIVAIIVAALLADPD